MMEFDVAILGAGIAGASLAADLSRMALSVLLLEGEAQPGYHSTGRSAALFSETYGNEQVRALSRASREFFFAPLQGFSPTPLVTPRGALHIATSDSRAKLAATAGHEDYRGKTQWLDHDALHAAVPVLGEQWVAGLYETDASDVDVHALHQGYLRLARANGMQLRCKALVSGLSRDDGGWTIETPDGAFRTPIVVNAAGAWGDELALLAGAAPVGLVPMRRTALLVDAPPGFDSSGWPLVIDVDETFYFKPDAGLLLVSPADETPTVPCDIQPEELDVAIAIDRYETATRQAIRRVASRWAGLRSFVADRSPVVGFDPLVEGFFWLVGQGGYGIQTAPAMARLAAALVAGKPVPTDLSDHGVDAGLLSPSRFAARSAEAKDRVPARRAMP